MPRSFRRTIAIVVACTFGVIGGDAAYAESVAGTVRVAIEGLSLADAGSIVVFVEAEMDPSVSIGESLSSVLIRQHGARFEPDFVVVTVGQEIQMPNDDTIYHNVFSYSEPNDFDLGLYASGESLSLRFEHPGLVRIYCSIHEAMDGLIFVAPTSLHTMVDEQGQFEISAVPDGRYRLHVWSERLPEIVQEIKVGSESSGALDGSEASEASKAEGLGDSTNLQIELGQASTIRR
jgi:plastocyanin